MVSKKRKLGLGIDWETTGSVFGGDSTLQYQGISFGAVIFDIETFEPVETLYREIKFDSTKYKWAMEAEKIHGLTREYLEANGVSQEQAAEDLMTMYVKYFEPSELVYFLGHNCKFDYEFSKQLLEPLGLMFKSFTWIDTSGIGLVMFGIRKSQELFDFLGLPPRNKHNALEDILLTLSSVKIMRQISNVALTS